MLNLAVEKIPLGTAYAIWTGIGAAGTAILGILFFRESANLLRVMLIIALIGSVVGLKMVSWGTVFMGSIYLLLSGAFEIGFTTCMKFDTWWGTILFLLFGFISFYMLTVTMKTIPLGTSYAVFSAIGPVGTAVVGILFFGEPATVARLTFLGLIVAVVVGLKFASAE